MKYIVAIDEKGGVCIEINSYDFVIKENESISLSISLGDFCKIEDSVDNYLFRKGEKHNQDNIVPWSTKHDLHDMLYGHIYEDGSDFTKAMCIALENYLDDNYINNKEVSFGDLFSKMHSYINDPSIKMKIMEMKK
jgi:hypothetical protein